MAKYAPTDIIATTATCRSKSDDRMDTAAVVANDSSGSSITYLNSDEVGAGRVEGSGLVVLAGAAVPFKPESSDGKAAVDLSGDDLTAARVVGGMRRWSTAAGGKGTNSREWSDKRSLCNGTAEQVVEFDNYLTTLLTLLQCNESSRGTLQGSRKIRLQIEDS